MELRKSGRRGRKFLKAGPEAERTKNEGGKTGNED